MKSAAAKGAFYKAKTRRWLEAHGYQVLDLEIVRRVWTPRGIIGIKRDQMASDVAGVSATEIVFIQIKGGTTRRTGLAAARKQFAQYTFPPGTKQWLLLWAPHARQPEIEVVSEGPIGATEAEIVIPKTKAARRRTALPLFYAEQW